MPGGLAVETKPRLDGCPQENRRYVDADQFGLPRPQEDGGAERCSLVRHVALTRDAYPGRVIDLRMPIGERQLAVPAPARLENAPDRRGLASFSGTHFVQIGEVGIVRKIESQSGFGERVVDDVNVLVIASASVGIDVDLDALRDHLSTTRIIVTRWGRLSTRGRGREIIADGAVRLDAVAAHGLHGLTFRR